MPLESHPGTRPTPTGRCLQGQQWASDWLLWNHSVSRNGAQCSGTLHGEEKQETEGCSLLRLLPCFSLELAREDLDMHGCLPRSLGSEATSQFRISDIGTLYMRRFFFFYGNRGSLRAA